MNRIAEQFFKFGYLRMDGARLGFLDCFYFIKISACVALVSLYFSNYFLF
jgi:hypothetical protein